jgi:hypothetical protein
VAVPAASRPACMSAPMKHVDYRPTLGPARLLLGDPVCAASLSSTATPILPWTPQPTGCWLRPPSTVWTLLCTLWSISSMVRCFRAAAALVSNCCCAVLSARGSVFRSACNAVFDAACRNVLCRAVMCCPLLYDAALCVTMSPPGSPSILPALFAAPGAVQAILSFRTTALQQGATWAPPIRCI